jgi:D-alanine-D-alanine ligase
MSAEDTGELDAPARGRPALRICLLTNQELDTDPLPGDDWPCDPRPFLPEADWHLEVLEDKAQGPLRTRELIEQGFDLYFNLCDGAEGQDDLPGIEVVQALEQAGVPFTGARSDFYEPTRMQMKQACERAGIAFPDYVVARGEEDVRRALERLEFPLFVKHHNSYASVDISRHSRVRSPGGLRRQVRKFVARHGAALIEEYIPGTECTVLVAENPDDASRPLTYTPIEYRFPQGESFKHEKLKWEDFDGLQAQPVGDPALAERLRRDAAAFFVELNGSSFGRCDLRVAPDGTPYMLEINANCGVYYPEDAAGGADLCLRFDPAGHVGFTRNLVAAALQRAARAAKTA